MAIYCVLDALFWGGFAGLVSSASGWFGLGGFAVVLYCGLSGCRFGYGAM